MQKSKEFVQRYQNKSLILFGMVFVLLFAPSISFALPITVISYDYDLSLEHYSAGYGVDITENYSYAGTGTGPSASHSITIPDSPSYYEPILGEVSPFNLYSEGFALGDESSVATLTAEWDFTPNHDHIRFKFEYDSLVQFTYGGNGGSSHIFYSLTDITDNYILASRSRSFSPEFIESPDMTERDYFVDDFTYNFSQDNIYRLKLFTSIWSGDVVKTRLGINLSTVPEPSTILLFGTGLAGLMGIRFRRKKK